MDAELRVIGGTGHAEQHWNLLMVPDRDVTFKFLCSDFGLHGSRSPSVRCLRSIMVFCIQSEIGVYWAHQAKVKSSAALGWSCWRATFLDFSYGPSAVTTIQPRASPNDLGSGFQMGSAS